MKRIKILLPVIIFCLGCTEEQALENVSINSELLVVEHNKASFDIQVSNPNNVVILRKGICWSDIKTPTIGDNISFATSPDENFTCYLKELSIETNYFARPFVETNSNIYYGQEQAFTTTATGLPTVETYNAENITTTSAYIKAYLRDDGNTDIIDNGLCLGTSPEPDIYNSTIVNYKNEKNLIANLRDLNKNTIYYLRAFAENKNGIAYSNEIVFKTSYSTLKDIDGNIYQTVKIGDQVWMRENLKTTHYANGRIIPDGTGLGHIKIKRQKNQFVYNDDPKNEEKLGRLYNWAAVMNEAESSNESPSGVQGVCPDGWHIPSDKEFQEMESYLGINSKEIDVYGYRGDQQGTEIKIGGSTGFDAIMAGVRAGAGYFCGMGSNGYFYTTTAYDDKNAIFRRLGVGTSTIERVKRSNSMGYSIRCVKD